MENPVRRRTLRRRQRSILLQEYRSDLAVARKLLDKAITPQELRAYSNLYDIIYKGYCELIDSEV